MQQPQHRSPWSDEETQYFLDLMLEKKVKGLLDGKRLKATDVFSLIAEQMPEKTVQQLMVKWKNLKGSYFKLIRENRRTGDDKTIPFYDDLERLLGERTGNITFNGGFDSIDIGEENNIVDVMVDDQVDDPNPATNYKKRKYSSNVTTEKKKQLKGNATFTEFMKEQNRQFFEFMAEESRKQREWEEWMATRHEEHQQSVLKSMSKTLFTLLSSHMPSHLKMQQEHQDSSDNETEIVYT